MIWLVRAGANGEQEDFALSNNVVVIGWEDVNDLSRFKTKDQLLKELKKVYDDLKPNTLKNWANQIWGFVDGIKKDDLVVLPLKSQSAIAVGKITGKYEYKAHNPEGVQHVRAVKWIKTDIPRSSFDQDLLYSMGAFLTVCRIQRNNAEARIKAVVNGKTPPKTDVTKDLETDELSAPDLEQYAKDQIQNYISRHFKGHEFTRLIAAILEAQGYKIHVSPEGPDGGVDILAGTGPMGFDEPKIAVQVKSGDTPVGTDVMLGLQGAIHNFGATNGLLVSWSGFKQSVIRESRKAFFGIRLWDANKVVQAIQENYEKLSDSMQAALPLKRIWTLVPEQD